MERFRWPQSVQLQDRLPKTSPITGHHRQATVTTASRTNHIQPWHGSEYMRWHWKKEREGGRRWEKEWPPWTGMSVRKLAKSTIDTRKHNGHENPAERKKKWQRNVSWWKINVIQKHNKTFFKSLFYLELMTGKPHKRGAKCLMPHWMPTLCHSSVLAGVLFLVPRMKRKVAFHIFYST